MRTIKNILSEVFSTIHNFFLYEESAYKVAVFRIVFGILVLASELLWLPHIRLYFTDNGYFGVQTIRANVSPQLVSLLYFVYTPIAVKVLYATLLGTTLCFILGIWSRVMSVVMYILLLSFQNRDLVIMYGGDSVLRIVAFYVLFLQTDKALVPRFMQKDITPKSTVPGWPIRLIQIQIAFIYLFGSLLKLNDTLWHGGTAVYWTINNINFGQFNLAWLGKYPFIINMMTFGSVATELTFFFLVWGKKTRLPILLAAVGMHLGILLTMNVVLFSEIMIGLYIVYLSEDEIRKIFSFLRNLIPSRQIAR